MTDQLNVHRNPGQNRRVIPFAVVVQSNQFRDPTRRVVGPLLSAREFGQADSDIGPHFLIDGQNVVRDPRQITHLPRDGLGPSVASLASEDTRWTSC